MSSTTTPALYVLMTLIQGVAHFSNPTSLHNCEEGRSIAFYGQTIEEKYKADLDAAQAVHAWYNDHPPRMPKNADEWALVAEAKCEDDAMKGKTVFCTGSRTNTDSEAILVDGYYYMIQDLQPVPSSVQLSPIGSGEFCQAEPDTSSSSGIGFTLCYWNIAVCIPESDVP